MGPVPKAQQPRTRSINKMNRTIEIYYLLMNNSFIDQAKLTVWLVKEIGMTHVLRNDCKWESDELDDILGVNHD